MHFSNISNNTSAKPATNGGVSAYISNPNMEEGGDLSDQSMSVINSKSGSGVSAKQEIKENE